MQNYRFLSVSVAILFTILLVFMFGCAKEAIVKDTSIAGASEKQQVVTEKQATAETDAEKAAQEKALKEAELREQERQRAEKEKAERERAATAVYLLNGMEFIYFDYGKDAVRDDDRDTLKKLADKRATPWDEDCDRRQLR